MTSFIFTLATQIWKQDAIYPVTNERKSFYELHTSHREDNEMTHIEISWKSYMSSITDCISFDSVSYMNDPSLEILTPIDRMMNIFNRVQILNMGYKASILKDNGYNAIELKNGGYSINDLKNAGYSLNDLKHADYSISHLINVGYSLVEIHNVGFSANELKNYGCLSNEMRELGYSLTELREIGYSSSELKEISSAYELKTIGFTLNELYEGGFIIADLYDISCTLLELKDAGYSALELNSYSLLELIDAGFLVESLHDAGYLANELHDLSYSLTDLKEGGYSVVELKDISCTIQNLIDAGYSVQNLKEIHSIHELKDADIGLNDLKNVFEENVLIKACFTISEFIGAKYTSFDPKYTKILLIDKNVFDYEVFVQSTNDTTLPIVYDESIKRNDFMSLLQKNKTIDRIGFCFDYTREYVFFNNELLFETGIKNNNTQFIITITNNFKIKNIDFLACNTLSDKNWVDFYDIIFKETGIKIGASDDLTGNIKMGGDWILETTNDDIEKIYFTQSIQYYNYLLGNGGMVNDIYYNNKIFLVGSTNYLINNNTLSRLISPLSKQIRSISEGRTSKHIIAIMTDNTIYGIGENNYGKYNS